MGIEYIGDGILVVEGTDIEVKNIRIRWPEKRKIVPTMNRTGHPIGFVKRSGGPGELTFTAPIRKVESIDLSELEDVLIVVEPAGGGRKTKLMGCCTVNTEDSYGGDEGAEQDITVEFTHGYKE